MKKILSASIAAATLALVVTPPEAEAAIAYSVDNALNLLRYDTSTPGVVTNVGSFSGAVTTIDSIDFRPANGLLYGYSFAANAVVTINVNNAFTSLATNPSTASNTFDLGIDFNPAADRLRLVNVNDQNLRINVDVGGANTIVDGTLVYAAADPFFGISPTINEAAYTNNVANAGSTQLYYVDYGLGNLVTTAAANGGVLNTVGSLGIGPITSFTGFDIVTDPFTGTNSAFAVLDTNTVFGGLYSINLGTGAASFIGQVDGTGVNSLAITPTAVPEPGSALAGVIALGACIAGRRRRQAQA